MEKSLFLHAVKRNVLYWGRHAEMMILMMLGICAFYGTIIGMGAHGRESIFFNMIFYISIVGLMFILITQITYASAYMPLVISFGAKRTESVWGIQFLNLLLIVQVTLLFIVTAAMGGLMPAIGSSGIGFFVLGAIFCAAAGQFGSAAYIRFGMKGMVIFCILLVAGMLALVGGMAGFFDRIVELVLGVLTGNFQILMLTVVIAVILFYVVSFLVFRKVIKNYEVRR